VKQITSPPDLNVKVTIICYEDTDEKKQIRKLMDELTKPLNSIASSSCIHRPSFAYQGQSIDWVIASRSVAIGA